MTLLLDAYDSNKETVELCKAREKRSADTSLVEIVDNETQTILAITVGSNDQEIMHKIVKIWSHAKSRYVTPGKHLPQIGLDPIDTYGLMCDAFLELNSSEVYRRADQKSKEGYLIDSAALQTIIDAAKKEVFANVRLAGCVSIYSDIEKDTVYETVNVEFNREPREQPVQTEQTPVSITKPISFFKNILQKLRRNRV